MKTLVGKVSRSHHEGSTKGFRPAAMPLLYLGLFFTSDLALIEYVYHDERLSEGFRPEGMPLLFLVSFSFNSLSGVVISANS